MKSSLHAAVSAAALFITGAAVAQSGGMLLDYAADQMIKKFQTSSCEQLKAAKAAPPTDKEKEAKAFLQGDAQAREAFVKKVAAPVLNKMFECGMIP
jgi:hypothetical protein